MSTKLRDFIAAVRACKSVPEEASLVAKECAAIRTAFKDENSSYRHRNVAKLIFIDMLGYPVTFGQVDCLKLIASTRFLEKRIGYLSLPIILDQESDVLMLATNTIKNDISSGSQYVASAALCALGNAATPEMIETLAREIEVVMTGSNPVLRKKAILLYAKMIRNMPDMAEKIAPKVPTLLADRNHAVVVASTHMLRSMICVLPKVDGSVKTAVLDAVLPLVKYLKELVSASTALAGATKSFGSAVSGNYGLKPGMSTSLEYDFQGVSDPFLQVTLLAFFREVVENILFSEISNESRDAMVDLCRILLLPSSQYRNSALSVVYEAVRLALSLVQAAQPNGPVNSSFGSSRQGSLEEPEWVRALYVQMSQWLDSFVNSKDNSVKFIGICLLEDFSKSSPTLVKRYRQTLLDCFKDTDVSLQRKAVTLACAMTDDSNAIETITELLNLLLVVTDPLPAATINQQPSGKDISFTLSTKTTCTPASTVSNASQNREKKLLLNVLINSIEQAIDKHAPTRSWQVDSLLRLCSLVGNLIQEKTKANIAVTLTETLELHDSVLRKIVYAMKQNLYQVALVEIGTWMLGDLCGKPVTVLPSPRRQHNQMQSKTETEAISGNLLDLESPGDPPPSPPKADQPFATAPEQAASSIEAGEALEIIRQVIRVFGFGIDRSRDSRECNFLPFLAQNRKITGVCGPIGGNCIFSYPMSSTHIIHPETSRLAPQACMPPASLTAVEQSHLVDVVVTALAKVGARSPHHRQDALDLMEGLSQRCLSLETNTRIAEYSVMLSLKEGCAILESRLGCRDEAGRRKRPIAGSTSADSVAWPSREDVLARQQESAGAAAENPAVKKTDLLSDEVLMGGRPHLSSAKSSGKGSTPVSKDNLLDDLLSLE